MLSELDLLFISNAGEVEIGVTQEMRRLSVFAVALEAEYSVLRSCFSHLIGQEVKENNFASLWAFLKSWKFSGSPLWHEKHNDYVAALFESFPVGLRVEHAPSDEEKMPCVKASLNIFQSVLSVCKMA